MNFECSVKNLTLLAAKQKKNKSDASNSYPRRVRFYRKFLSKHLLAHTTVDVIIAGRSLEKARAFVNELDSPRVSARQIDASDLRSLEQALQGVTLCLVAAPTTHHAETVIRACINSHVDYLDVQFSSQKLHALYAAEKEIQKAGLCFITETGYHPGLPSVLVRNTIGKLDVVKSALVAGYLNMKSLPYTEAVDELMEGFIDYGAGIQKWNVDKTHIMGNARLQFRRRHWQAKLLLNVLRGTTPISKHDPFAQRRWFLYRGLQLVYRPARDTLGFCGDQTRAEARTSSAGQVDVVVHGVIQAAICGGALGGSKRSIRREAG